MELKGNTILITGGSSGLGLEMAKRFLELGNKVLICGRSMEKLNKAKEELPAIYIRACDISNADSCKELATWVKNEHPMCNILVNNAAVVHRGNFVDREASVEKMKFEVNTNLVAPMILTKLFMPILEKNHQPTIINISSGLAYVPKKEYSFYNAAKAGLHSFTKTLGMQLAGTGFLVIEVLFPVVDTPWHQGNVPSIAISPEKAINEMLLGLRKGSEEIRVGKVKLLYWLSRIAPKFAQKKINETSN